MPEPLKNIYNDAFFREFSKAVKAVLPAVNRAAFIAACRSNGWEKMELKQRMRHLATTLHDLLPGNYKNKLTQVLKIMDALPAESTNQYGSLAYMLLPDFVEQYGLQDPRISLKAMEKISTFTSCEFAIRPFLIKYPEQVMAQMLVWSTHRDDKIRRFASEGCRPRLPWAMAIPELKRSPAPILPILEQLKNDPSEFVRRSVANNLNDIAKDHPALVIKIAKKWMGKTAETDKIARHGCRSLLKQAHPEALHLFGTASGINCSISNLALATTTIKIGDTLPFSFSLVLNEQKPAKLRIEFALHFMKANGKQNKKIFKIAENTYPAGKICFFSRKLSFKDLSTRKHYPGRHRLAIIINGTESSGMDFMVSG